MKIIIIAEAGVNHNGDVLLAKELIDVAKDSGADYVKFQIFKSELLSTAEAKKAEYQKKDDKNESQKEMLENLEFDFEVGPLRKRLIYEKQIFTGGSSNKNVLRILPPLTVQNVHFDQLFDAIKDIL